ncbi:hypothetical protein VKT23_009125 [Stygiomarasmius scandens]|uniref:Uncharacterized protein n=1 Tax=Marasmiellus scandens TaxID=2682957 RepID=A0ABR1JEF9_9AGAR
MREESEDSRREELAAILSTCSYRCGYQGSRGSLKRRFEGVSSTLANKRRKKLLDSHSRLHPDPSTILTNLLTMELRPRRGRDSYLTLRVPTQACRFLRTHHPYKRVLCIENSPLQPRIDLFGEDVDRFLVAVRSMAATPSAATRTSVAASQSAKPKAEPQGEP